MKKKISKLSFVIPCYNEKNNLSKLISDLNRFALDQKVNYEILIVDDGSNDNSSLVLKKIIKKNRKIKMIKFTRNFGKSFALLAGLRYSSGSTIITLDADLQHPISQIKKFINTYKTGEFEVINGVQKNKLSVLNIVKNFIYFILNCLSPVKLLAGASEFYLLSRKVVNEIIKFSNNSRLSSIRSFLAYSAYDTKFIEYQPNPRFKGKTKFNLSKLYNVFIKSLIFLSDRPLRIIGFFGIFIMAVMLIIFLSLITFQIFYNYEFKIITLQSQLIVFLFGVNFFCLGIFGEYLSYIIYDKNNSIGYVIKEKVNLR